jgi:hypothetical protein
MKHSFSIFVSSVQKEFARKWPNNGPNGSPGEEG